MKQYTLCCGYDLVDKRNDSTLMTSSPDRLQFPCPGVLGCWGAGRWAHSCLFTRGHTQRHEFKSLETELVRIHDCCHNGSSCIIRVHMNWTWTIPKSFVALFCTRQRLNGLRASGGDSQQITHCNEIQNTQKCCVRVVTCYMRKVRVTARLTLLM